MKRIDKIVALILLEAEERKTKLGLVADIYGVSMEIDHRLLDIMGRIRKEKRRKIDKAKHQRSEDSRE